MGPKKKKSQRDLLKYNWRSVHIVSLLGSFLYLIFDKNENGPIGICGVFFLSPVSLQRRASNNIFGHLMSSPFLPHSSPDDIQKKYEKAMGGNFPLHKLDTNDANVMFKRYQEVELGSPCPSTGSPVLSKPRACKNSRLPSITLTFS